MYKVADYVTRCIDSLENQDIDKNQYEIICINDGSPDNCSEIVENLKKKYSNIILINQENQGVSIARNNGIAIATGKYILPIDPDDYVVPQLLKSILDRAESADLDILVLGFEIFDPTGKSIWNTDYRQQEPQVYSGVEGYFASRGYEVRDPDRSWAILYRNEMLQQHQLQYPEGVPFLEDGCFLLKVFSVAEGVGFVDRVFYQRTTSGGSATVSGVFYSDKAIQGFIKAALDLKHFSAHYKLAKPQQELLNHGIAKYVLLSISPSIGAYQFMKYFSVISMLKRAGLAKLETDGLRFLYKKHIKMYNLSKLFFPLYFRLINR